MHPSVLAFAEKVIRPEHVTGLSVLDVGSLDVNGTLRPMIEAMSPESYLGVDMRPGPGVDLIRRAEQLRFEEQFDLIVCTEMLEHCLRWDTAVYRMKVALKVGGHLLLTTRSQGFPLHGYPDDHWRFTLEDLAGMVADFDALRIEADPTDPGVFGWARRVKAQVEMPLASPTRMLESPVLA